MAVAEELRPGIAARVLSSPSLRLAGRRLLAAIPVLWGVTFLTYVVMNLLPGDAAQELLGANATPAEVHQLEIELHLNEPFWVRYGHWLGGVLQGDLGTSVVNGENVTTILGARLPVTAELLGYAFVASIVLAVGLGVLAARKPNGIADRFSIVVSMTGLSVAPYVLALVLIYIFAVRLQWFPAIRYTSPSANLVENVKSLTLPAVAIGFPLFSVYTRLLRADIVEQMQREDYIVTARARRGQGRVALADPAPARAAELDVRAHPPDRAQPRHAGRRGGHHRADLLAARRGRDLDPVHQRSRRARRRGDRRRLRRGRGGRQPAHGRAVHGPGPAD